MDPLFNLSTYVDERLAHTTTPNILELYSEDELVPYHENHVYEEVVIPNGVEVFINELNVRRIVAPESIRVIDHMPYMIHSLEFSMPKLLEHIILRDVNIIGKEFKELFPTDVYYRYENCSLNGTPIHELIVSKYKTLFNQEPTYTTNDIYNQPLTKNSISKKLHGHILNHILSGSKKIGNPLHTDEKLLNN